MDLKEGRYFPRTLQDMLLYQAILMRNVPATTIHSQMPLVEQYVHEFGGGFAMLGGQRSFGPGGYYQTPVETVLPVRMDLINKKYLADVAMVIVIDKSGSMSYADRGRQKIDLADEGGARVASLLKQTDQLGVLAVDSVAKWAYPVQRLSNKADAIDAIISVRAGGGGIYVYSGLREAYQTLANIKASVKHVILFADTADCEEKEGASGESSLSLASRAFRDHQITTTTIGIGETGDQDVTFLEQLATIAAGRFYFTNDMFTLPEIFAQESAVVQRNYITEETFSPRINQIEPLLSGLAGVPDLDGYVATSAKAFATISLTSDRDDPVLAFWRHGLGQSVAYTSDPVGSWGAKWLAWSDWERFWAQVGRYLARNTEPADFQVSVNATGGHTTIVVDTFDATGLEEDNWSGALVDSDGNEHELDFARTAHGRIEARIEATGSLFGKVFRHQNDQVLQEAIVQFAAPANREYEISGEGMERLKQMTGSLVQTADQLKFDSKTATDVQPVRSRLLLWAILLFLVDVATRKLDLQMFRSARKLQPASVPVAVPQLERLKIRKSQIEKQRPVIVQVDPFEGEQPKPAGTLPQPESDYMKRLKDAKKKLKDQQS
ncbi:MAG: VWA domain-containing protein [Acidobacteriota bacterium]